MFCAFSKLVVSFLDGNKPEKQIIKRCERLIKANELKTSDDIVIVYNNIDEVLPAITLSILSLVVVSLFTKKN